MPPSASFACSFAFGELKLMEGSAKILSLIARDESQHLALTQNIINTWRKDESEDSEMTKIMHECEDEVYDMYNVAINEAYVDGLPIPDFSNFFTIDDSLGYCGAFEAIFEHKHSSK